LSTIQFHLSFKGHQSQEYCCLVIHLTSVSIISYAELNGGIFVLIGRIKPEISHKAQQKVDRESPRLIRKKTFPEHVQGIFSRRLRKRIDANKLTNGETNKLTGRI
jgi:hypothetical protein